MAHTNGTLPFINKYSGSQKLFFCILLGILTYFVSSPGLQLLVRLMTTFTLRYAHMFYGNNEQKPDTHAGGLEFPNDDEPDYLDFAYFSFNVGMTFQVSDVQVTSKRIRKMVLLHSLISFLFATIMIALTINLIS